MIKFYVFYKNGDVFVIDYGRRCVPCTIRLRFFSPLQRLSNQSFVLSTKYLSKMTVGQYISPSHSIYFCVFFLYA